MNVRKFAVALTVVGSCLYATQLAEAGHGCKRGGTTIVRPLPLNPGAIGGGFNGVYGPMTPYGPMTTNPGIVYPPNTVYPQVGVDGGFGGVPGWGAPANPFGVGTGISNAPWSTGGGFGVGGLGGNCQGTVQPITCQPTW